MTNPISISFEDRLISVAFDEDEDARTVDGVDQVTIRVNGIDYEFARYARYPEGGWFFGGAAHVATNEEADVYVLIRPE